MSRFAPFILGPGLVAFVVCGRRKDPYSLPLYGADDGTDVAQYGGNRERQMAQIRGASSLRANGSPFCTPPMAVNIFQVVPGVIKIIKALTDGE